MVEGLDDVNKKIDVTSNKNTNTFDVNYFDKSLQMNVNKSETFM